MFEEGVIEPSTDNRLKSWSDILRVRLADGCGVMMVLQLQWDSLSDVTKAGGYLVTWNVRTKLTYKT